VLVWAGAQNTIAKNATMMVTTAMVFILGSLFVMFCVGGNMRTVELRLSLQCWFYCGLIGFGNVIDTLGIVASVFVQKFC
jgi:hypothetical protein